MHAMQTHTHKYTQIHMHAVQTLHTDHAFCRSLLVCSFAGEQTTDALVGGLGEEKRRGELLCKRIQKRTREYTQENSQENQQEISQESSQEKSHEGLQGRTGLKMRLNMSGVAKDTFRLTACLFSEVR